MPEPLHAHTAESAPAPAPGSSPAAGVTSAPRNIDLLRPYLLPYIAYVGVATLASDLARELDYTIRIVLTAGLLIFLWKRYQPIAGPKSVSGSVLVGAAAGLVGVVLWIGLLLPFQDASEGTAFTLPAFALRLAAATLIVPLIEELLFRGYILGLVTQWQAARAAGVKQPFGAALDKQSVHEITPGAWTWVAVAISSVVFAAGHAPIQWPAAIAYGVLMSMLWIARRDLIAPITAHAVTNFVLYIYVYTTGSWGLW